MQQMTYTMAAQILGIHRQTIYDWKADGRIPQDATGEEIVSLEIDRLRSEADGVARRLEAWLEMKSAMKEIKDGQSAVCEPDIRENGILHTHSHYNGRKEGDGGTDKP